MGFRHREIEVKLLVMNMDLETVNRHLKSLFSTEITRTIFGSSVDTYWSLGEDVKGQFIRMRERDGIRQITVKGKDRGSNINRIEIDVDSTSDVSTINKLLNAAHGKAAGRIGKTYYVHWLEGESEHTNVCCYCVEPEFMRVYPHIVIEVESTTESKMLEIEAKVSSHFSRQGYVIERAPGSLYEMFINTKESK